MAQLDLARISQTRRQAESVSGLHFSVWVGDSDEKPRALAERLHSSLSEPERSVYVVCDVKQRAIEIVTGAHARQTLTDDECLLATRSMREVLAYGDVTEALVRGLVHLGSYAID